MIIMIETTIAYPAIIATFVLMILVGIEPIMNYLEKLKEYKAARKEIEFDIRVWTDIAKSCDPISDASDKGYAIARLVILNHELEKLEEERKNVLCS